MEGNNIPWPLISVIASIVVAWSGLLLGVIKWFLANYFKDVKAKFADLSQAIGRQTGETHRLDMEILKLRGEVHSDFVRRDDAIREQVVINAKLDALAAKIENLSMRSTHAH